MPSLKCIFRIGNQGINTWRGSRVARHLVRAPVALAGPSPLLTRAARAYTRGGPSPRDDNVDVVLTRRHPRSCGSVKPLLTKLMLLSI